MSFGSNVFAPNSDSHGLGYNGVNVTLNYFDGLPVLQNINSKELQVLFKSLLKRDDTTKEKALNDLKQILRDESNKHLFEEDIFVISWSQLYAKLATSNSKIIRSGSHEFTALLIRRLGKPVSRFLREFVPLLLAGLMDPDGSVSGSCHDNLLKCFKDEDKIESLWVHFSSPILNYVKQVVLLENENTISDERYSTKDESLMRYERLMISTISALIQLLDKVELEATQSEELHMILSFEGLWSNISLKSNKNLRLYQTLLRLMVTLNDGSLFRKNKEALKLSSKRLFQSLNDCNARNLIKISIIIPDILRTLIAMNTYKEGRFWKYDSSSKKILSHFLSLGPGTSEPVYYSLVLAIFQHTQFLEKETFWIPLWKSYLEIEKGRKVWGRNGAALLLECWKCYWKLLDNKFSGKNQDSVQNELLELLSSKKLCDVSEFAQFLNTSDLDFDFLSEEMTKILITNDRRKDADVILLENIIYVLIAKPILLEGSSWQLIEVLDGKDELDQFAKVFALKFFDALLNLHSESARKQILKFAEKIPLIVSENFVDIPTISMNGFAKSRYFSSQMGYNLLIDFILSVSLFDPKRKKVIVFLNGLPSEILSKLTPEPLVSDLVREYVSSYEFDDPYIFGSKLLNNNIFHQLHQNAQHTNSLSKFFEFARLIPKDNHCYIQLLTSTKFLVHEIIITGKIDVPTEILENDNYNNEIVQHLKSEFMNSAPELHSKILGALCSLTEDSPIVTGLLTFSCAEFFNSYVPSLDSRLALSSPIGLISNLILESEILDASLARNLIAFSQLVDGLLQKFPGLITHELLLFQTWVYELVVDYNSIVSTPIYDYNNVTFYTNSSQTSFSSIINQLFGNSKDLIPESLLDISIGDTIAIFNCRILYRISLNSVEYLSDASFEELINGIEKYTRTLLSAKQRDLISISYLGSLFCSLSRFGSKSKTLSNLRNMLTAELVGVHPTNEIEPKRCLVPITLLSSLLNYTPVEKHEIPMPLNRLNMALTSIESWTQSDLWYEPIFDKLRLALLQLFARILKFETFTDFSGKLVDLASFISLDSLDILQIEETEKYDQLRFYTLDLLNASYQFISLSDEFRLDSLVEVMMIKSESKISISNVFCQPLGSLMEKIPIKSLIPFYEQYVELLLHTSISLPLMSVTVSVLRRIIIERQQTAVLEHELVKSFRTAGTDNESDIGSTDKINIPAVLLAKLHEKMPEDYMEFSDLEEFTRYLNYCHVLTFYFADISYDLRQIYISQLKATNLVDRLLNFLNDQLVLTDFKYWDDIDPANILKNEKVQFCYVETSLYACNISMLLILDRMLSIFGSLTSTWWLNIKSREEKEILSKFVTRYISPGLIEKELDIISGGLNKFQTEDMNLNIKINRTIKEIKVSYLIDEQKLEVAFNIPANYPLQSVQVSGVSRIGISDQKWKSWILSTQRIINSMNGTVLDSIEFLSKNVKLQFSGFEECAICYYILHAIDRKLPSKVCPTCKNRFHGACLYKWFKSSGNNTCPMCRGEFSLRK